LLLVAVKVPPVGIGQVAEVPPTFPKFPKGLIVNVSPYTSEYESEVGVPLLLYLL